MSKYPILEHPKQSVPKPVVRNDSFFIGILRAASLIQSARIDITPEQARLDFAIGLYIDRKITLGQGARIASLTQGHFLRELGKRKVPVNYDVGEFRKDMQTLKKLNKA